MAILSDISPWQLQNDLFPCLRYLPQLSCKIRSQRTCCAYRDGQKMGPRLRDILPSWLPLGEFMQPNTLMHISVSYMA